MRSERGAKVRAAPAKELHTNISRSIVAAATLLALWAGSPQAQEDVSAWASAASADEMAAATVTDGPITVARIRLTIGGVEYAWEGGSPPERSDGFTAPATVLSFLDFGPGSSMKPKELEERCAAARDRLRDSGFFYDASVAVVPPSRYPDRRTVLVEVTEGFTWRFGGGYAYAFAGQDNAAGERKSWGIALGYDLDAFFWRDELFLGLPLFYGVETAFSHTLGDPFLSALKVEGAFEFGWRPHPDLRLASTTRLSWREIESGSALASFPSTATLDGALLAGTALGAEWRTHRRFDDGAEFAFAASLSGDADFPAGNGALLSARGSAAVRYGVSYVEFAALASVGSYLPGAEAPAPLLFDLYSAPDASIRSGYPVESLLADGYAFGSFEIRLRGLAVPLSDIFSISVSPFCFADLALLSRAGSDSEAEAFGAGLRLGFENPVFAYFTFAYGWNRFGTGRLTMTGSAGF